MSKANTLLINGLAGKIRKPMISIGMPIYNADRFLQETLESISAQTFEDFEVIMSDDASTDTSKEICINYVKVDKRFRYHRNKINIGALQNGIQVFEMSTGPYFMWAADHDLWKSEALEHYLNAASSGENTVLVYSPATIIDQIGDIIKTIERDKILSSDMFSTFLYVITGGIASSAICGLFKADAMEKSSIYDSIGYDTIFLAELSLNGNFIQLYDSYFYSRQIRKIETATEKVNRYVSTTFDDADRLMKGMPYEYMVYKYFCMVQSNDLSRYEQGVLNTYILDTFTRFWGVKPAAIIKVISEINHDHQLAVQSKLSSSFSKNRRFKEAKHLLDVTAFAESLSQSEFSGFAAEVLTRTQSKGGGPQRDLAQKKFPSDKHYDVCYLLYDTAKWGGVKGTIAQANGLVDRGYRVCIVSRTARPDWIDIKADFIASPKLLDASIPESDIVVGTWYPTVPLAFSSKKGICAHYCRGYEAQAPGLSTEQKAVIEKVYRLPTVKIANSPHVGRLLKEHFPGEVFIVRNDIDHSVFFPDRKRALTEGTVRILIVGPYEVAWKGVRDCLEACRVLSRAPGISIAVVRASQTPQSEQEKQLARDLECSYDYRFNLSEKEMAVLYNECDILLSGSYPFVESFGRPAMEALACGLPSVLTDIPAYKDYDDTHDYALFVEPGNVEAMAEAVQKLMNGAELRQQLIRRGIEVSANYSLERTIDELDHTLQRIYDKHCGRIETPTHNAQYYRFSRPEIQAMVSPNAGRILDVGCASGQLGAELKGSLGAEVWGVEVVESVAREAEPRLDRVIHGGIEEAMPTLPDSYFDTIILADVLEHLNDPYAVLETIKSKLTPHGEILASIPNVRHWSVLKGLLEGRWDYQDAGILDRTHLRFFTRQSVIGLFQNAGLEIREMKATTQPGGVVPEDIIKALSKANVDVSTLKEEGNHYQYLVRAVVKEVAKDLVSIVILTYNQQRYTQECVDSISRYTPEPHEIIFVDNGSKDGTVKWLRNLSHENSNYHLIENPENLGFATGCNQGIKASSGAYILLLNNDVVVTEGWLSGMIECLKSAPDVGIVGPMTNNISGTQKVIDASYASVDYLDGYAKAFREINRHRRVSSRRIVGFCMLFRRELVNRIGLLDESFGSGNFEDDDFCLRAALLGYSNLIAGDVFIHHYGSRSFVGNKIDFTAAMARNQNIFKEKWTGIDTQSPLGKKLLVLNAMERAGELNHKDQLGQAIEAYLQAIRHSPEDRHVYLSLAEVLIDAKRFKDALDALNEMPPDDTDLRRIELIGYSREGLAQYGEADDYADRALFLSPASAPAFNLKGILAYKRGDQSTAEGFFHKAIASDPGYGEPYTNLGVLKWAADHREEGLNLLERGFVLAPTHMDSSTLYHSAVTALQEFERAEKVFRDANALYPVNKKLKYLLIDIIIQQGKYDAAMQLIEEAMIVFGTDDGLVSAALDIRKKIGAKTIHKTSKTKGTLSLCMIVKNEEEHLPKCLASVKSVVDEMIIVDTGSTDRTIDVAIAFGAQVYDIEWTNDFSEARNYSISKASGDWILILDADEVVSPRDYGALSEIVRKKSPKPGAFSIVTRNYTHSMNITGWTANNGEYGQQEAGTGWNPSKKVRLFSNDRHIQFQGPVHELVEHSLRKIGIPIRDCNIVIHHYGKLNTEKVVSKGREYYLLGKAKLMEGERNIKSLTELAIQAAELGELEDALDLWQKARELNPESADIFLNIGYLNIKLERYEDALFASKRAMELDSNLKEAALNYSIAELCAGNAKRALVVLEDLLARVPDYPLAIGATAAAYLADGGREKGLDYLAKLKRKGFSGALTLHGHAKRLVSAGRIDYAISLLEAAVASNNADEEVLSLLAKCYMTREGVAQSHDTQA